MKAVFDEFGLKCGFAIFRSDPLYRGYAEEGFEIMAHNVNALSNADEATIRASMQQGKGYVESLGLICHGWVTPSSILQEQHKPIVKDYFEYGFTTYKGNTPSDQTHTISTNSYALWRVHMKVLKDNYESIFANMIQNNGMVCVYGHSVEITEDNEWRLIDLRTILQYCVNNGIEVLTPYLSCLKLYSDIHN